VSIFRYVLISYIRFKDLTDFRFQSDGPQQTLLRLVSYDFNLKSIDMSMIMDNPSNRSGSRLYSFIELILGMLLIRDLDENATELSQALLADRNVKIFVASAVVPR
jgi:hypothetical protein